MPANAGLGGRVLLSQSWQAFETAPKNVAGTVVEAEYSAFASTGDLSPVSVLAFSNGDEPLNRTQLLPNEAPQRFQIDAGDWSWNNSGALSVGVHPDPEGSLVVGGTVDVNVKVYLHAPPPGPESG